MITIQAGYALVVDDEPANRDFLERLLQTASFKVVGVGSGAAALEAAKKVPQLALALVDHELPDVTGLDLIRQFRAMNPDTLLVMATMHDDRELMEEAFNAGSDVFLVKPHGFMELYRRLKEVDSDTSLLRALIIDQYGPRPYKGNATGRRTTQESEKAKSPSTATAKSPAAAVTPEVKPVEPVVTPPPAPVAQPSTPAATVTPEVKPVEPVITPPPAPVAQPSTPTATVTPEAKPVEPVITPPAPNTVASEPAKAPVPAHLAQTAPLKPLVPPATPKPDGEEKNSETPK